MTAPRPRHTRSADRPAGPSGRIHLLRRTAAAPPDGRHAARPPDRPRLPDAVAALVALVLAAQHLAVEGVLALVPFRAGRRALLRTRAWPATAAALVLAGVAGLAAQQLQAERRRPVEDAPAAEGSWAALLPPTPAAAAHALLTAVADGDPDLCTTGLGPAAALQLTTATGTPDCPTAVHALAAHVVDPQRYGHPATGPVAVAPAGDGTIQIVDACHLSWPDLGAVRPGPAPGPQLGHLALAAVRHRGYQITAYAPC